MKECARPLFSSEHILSTEVVGSFFENLSAFFTRPLFGSIGQERIPHSRRTAATGTNKHDIGNRKGPFHLDDSALGIVPRRAPVDLAVIDGFHQNTSLFRKNLQDPSFFSSIFSRRDCHGIVFSNFHFTPLQGLTR